MIQEEKKYMLQGYIANLNSHGYAPYQITRIIKEEIGVLRIDDLTNEQYEHLVVVFENYLKFANNCRSVK